MIEYVHGTLQSKNLDNIIVEAGGIGYSALVPASTISALPVLGETVKIFISESSSMYGGTTTWYGFLTEDERDLFGVIKGVSKIGAKSSLDILSKIHKDLPEFRKAINDKDIKTLTSFFGLTKKTSEKLILGLKDKITSIILASSPISESGEMTSVVSDSRMMVDAIEALVSLGYKENTARKAVKDIVANKEINIIGVEDIITYALKNI